MAARKNIINDIEMFLAKTFPNITDRQQGSPAAKSRAAAAKKLAAKRKEVLKRNSAEGPKRSVAKPQPGKAARVNYKKIPAGSTETFFYESSPTRTKTTRGTVTSPVIRAMAKTSSNTNKVASARSNSVANRKTAAAKKAAIAKKMAPSKMKYGKR